MFATSIIRGNISITDMESVSLRFWQRENYGSFLEERLRHMERICKRGEISNSFKWAEGSEGRKRTTRHGLCHSFSRPLSTGAWGRDSVVPSGGGLVPDGGEQSWWSATAGVPSVLSVGQPRLQMLPANWHVFSFPSSVRKTGVLSSVAEEAGAEPAAHG